jgi:hypothetical protein
MRDVIIGGMYLLEHFQGTFRDLFVPSIVRSAEKSGIFEKWKQDMAVKKNIKRTKN